MKNISRLHLNTNCRNKDKVKAITADILRKKYNVKQQKVIASETIGNSLTLRGGEGGYEQRGSSEKLTLDEFSLSSPQHDK